MTKKETHTPSKTLRIPTREEFHRFASNTLSESDFCTQYPSTEQINKVADALNWSYKLYGCRSIY